MSETQVHPTAVVAAGAQLDAGVVVGPYAVIDAEVRLAAGCRVGAHAVVTGCTEVGADTVIHPHAVVGGPPQDLKHDDAPTRLRVGARNQIREGVTIHTGTVLGGGETVVGDDNVIMANAHVAHDCRVGSHVILANNVMLAGHVIVQDAAILNGGVGIHHFTTVGRLAYVGGLSRITRDVPPFMIVEGHPSRVRSVNVIGAKRAGFPEASVRALKDAFKLLFKSHWTVRDASDRLRERFPDVEPVLELVDFLARSEEGRQGRQGEEKGRGLAP